MRSISFERAARALLAAALLAVPAAGAGAQTVPRWAVELEGGAVWPTRNDVQVPNEAPATRFSLADLVGRGPRAAWRAYLTWNFDDRHAVRLLAAPLSITADGVPGQPLVFAGSTFAAGVPATATYRFNSFRLTYRWRFHHGARWSWWLGGTAKIRDAEIRLSQGTTTAQKTDLGFVPLLHVAGEARLGRGWQAGLDVDAIAGGPGRAEDVALKFGRDVGDRWRIAAGYRTVEGGADVPSVYTFAWLHYAVLSVTRRF